MAFHINFITQGKFSLVDWSKCSLASRDNFCSNEQAGKPAFARFIPTHG
jgi:hypothetical protein